MSKKIVYGDNEVDENVLKTIMSGNFKVNNSNFSVKDIEWSLPKSNEELLEEIKGSLKNVNTDEELEEIEELLERLEERMDDGEDTEIPTPDTPDPDPEPPNYPSIPTPPIPGKDRWGNRNTKTKMSGGFDEETMEKVREMIEEDDDSD